MNKIGLYPNKIVMMRTRKRAATQTSNNLINDHESQMLLSMKMANSDITMRLYTSDLACLAEDQFINDQLIDFWVWYYMSNMNERDRLRTHVFSTYFYRSLTTRLKRRSSAPWESDPTLTPAEKRHHRVKKWTKNVDIFSKDFIILPINDAESLHWYLAIICFPGITGICNIGDAISQLKVKSDELKMEAAAHIDNRDPDVKEVICNPKPNIKNHQIGAPNIKRPCILIFDSMANSNKKQHARTFHTLRDYVQIEHKVRKGYERELKREDMPGYSPQVPEQPNEFDCGIYVLEYVESFFNKPIKSFALPLRSTLRNWFPNTIVYTKRQEIFTILVDLIKTHNPENVPSIPDLKFHPPPSRLSTPTLTSSIKSIDMSKSQASTDLPKPNALPSPTTIYEKVVPELEPEPPSPIPIEPCTEVPQISIVAEPEEDVVTIIATSQTPKLEPKEVKVIAVIPAAVAVSPFEENQRHLRLFRDKIKRSMEAKERNVEGTRSVALVHEHGRTTFQKRKGLTSLPHTILLIPQKKLKQEPDVQPVNSINQLGVE